MQDSIAIISKFIAYSGEELKTDSLLIYYSIDGAAYQTAKMTTTGNAYEYVGYIKGYHYGSSVDYYVFGADESGHRYTQPSYGAVEPHHFVIEAAPTTFEQTVALNAGWSWWSTNLDITLDQLKNAIAAAVGTNGTASIKSQEGAITYRNGQWRGTAIQTLDIRKMYELQTSVPCEITLTGAEVNPSDYEITIQNGTNWIGYLCGVGKTLNEAFGTFPVDGDVMRSRDNSSVYRNGQWRGQLSGLEPGMGYIYESNATNDRTFTY